MHARRFRLTLCTLYFDYPLLQIYRPILLTTFKQCYFHIDIGTGIFKNTHFSSGELDRD